jgi:ABC-type branched-subunit amino acid transport system substrate-binding protein
MVQVRPTRPTGRRTGAVALAAAASAVSLALAACGSRLDPDTVAAAQGTNGAVAQDGSVPGTSDPGAAAGAGTGTGDTGRGDTGSTDKGSGSGGGATQGTGENSATGTVKAGNCDGFKNQTGITDSKITLANVSDISGPVPGIFESAQEATRAYAAYFNSTGDLCGRKLDVVLLDSRADSGADQQAYTKACDEAFAAVGSMSAFDAGGAATAEQCGLPDIRSTAVNPERNECSTCFAAQAIDPGDIPSAVHKYFLKAEHDATQHAAMLYINAGAAPVNAKAFAEAAEKNGWKEDYVQGIDVSEFNYAPYVQEMKDAGVKLVQYVGPYQNTVKLQQAMQQQGFDPEVYLQDATIYDSRYVEQAGDEGEGAYVYMNNQMFERTNIQEMALYQNWLQQVKPGATPTFFGLYAWSAARLFVEQSVALGGKLSRKTLVDAMSKVDNWTGNGLHVPMHVGPKETAECTMIIQLNNGTWTQRSSGKFLCAPTTSTE